jgi:antitoxin FitA
MRPGTALF